MELQSFISSNEDYFSIFKIHGFKVVKYKNLILVKNYYDKPLSYTNETDYWKMYCRGAVIDVSTRKVICLPPVKAREYDMEKDNLDSSHREIQYLIDGTMVNLFFNGEWIISTRSDIGGRNKWANKKSFKQMFDECSDIEYDKLNKECCYSFVMRHKDNRNVSPIVENKLILVDAYKLNQDNEKTIERIENSKFSMVYPGTEKITNIEFNELVDFKSYEIKGYTIKQGNKRYKLINPLFEYVKAINPNMNCDLFNYIELRKNGNLKEYLKYFPEYSGIFTNYRNDIHNISNELYNNYKNHHIFKNIERKEIPYNLKPMVEDIHKIYIETKKPTRWNDIKEYIHNMPSKKLIFALNNS